MGNVQNEAFQQRRKQEKGGGKMKPAGKPFNICSDTSCSSVQGPLCKW